MIEKLIEELQALTLEPEGFVLIVVGKEQVTEQISTFTMASLGNLSFVGASLLLYEIEDVKKKLLEIEWGEKDE